MIGRIKDVAAQLAGWPTPKTNDENQSRTNDPQGYSERCYNRKGRSQVAANFIYAFMKVKQE